MEYQNRRYLSLLGVSNDIDICPTLETNIATDYLIVWWWVAGLHAAQALIEKKCSVTLVEKNICGGGMSGRSGWFLTPDSELWLRQMEHTYGRDSAIKLRSFGERGQQSIVGNIEKYGLHCDLRKQDSLLLGLGKQWLQEVLNEYDDRKRFAYDAEYIDNHNLIKHNAGKWYTWWLRYTNCYAINPMQYCQELKHRLIKQWVRIHEFTHVHNLGETEAKTNLWSIRFKKAIICPWKAERAVFSHESKHTYGIHNYITISEPLHHDQVRSMMPSGECMCRDTELVFNYYRLTGDRRIVLGGWNPLSSFQPFDILEPSTIALVIRSFKKMFPALQNVEFPHYRSWRIQASKDLMPLVWPSKQFNNHYRVQWAVWLPRAAGCGRFVTELMHNEANETIKSIFSYDRSFFIPVNPSRSILKAPLFWISNGKAMWLF